MNDFESKLQTCNICNFEKEVIGYKTSDQKSPLTIFEREKSVFLP